LLPDHSKTRGREGMMSLKDHAPAARLSPKPRPHNHDEEELL